MTICVHCAYFYCFNRSDFHFSGSAALLCAQCWYYPWFARVQLCFLCSGHSLHAVMSWSSSVLPINSKCQGCISMCCWMENCNNAHHTKIPCQMSHCPYPADLCTANVSSSLRFTRMGENGSGGAGKEGSCSEYDSWHVITTLVSVHRLKLYH